MGVELGNRLVVARFKTGNVVALRGEITEEGASRRFTKADAEQVVDLGRDGCRQDQSALLLVANSQQLFELRLPGVGQCDQRSRIEDKRQAPKPRISSSSGISEIGRESVSMRSKLPARAKLRSRLGAGR